MTTFSRGLAYLMDPIEKQVAGYYLAFGIADVLRDATQQTESSAHVAETWCLCQVLVTSKKKKELGANLTL